MAKIRCQQSPSPPAARSHSFMADARRSPPHRAHTRPWRAEGEPSIGPPSGAMAQEDDGWQLVQHKKLPKRKAPASPPSSSPFPSVEKFHKIPINTRVSPDVKSAAPHDSRSWVAARHSRRDVSVLLRVKAKAGNPMVSGGIPSLNLPRQLYKVQAGRSPRSTATSYMGCHKVPFPYRMYYCHMTPVLLDRSYVVSLCGIGKGSAADMLACYHLDTA
ncbi:hypothetical protein EJB05_51639, partial [Eragrostis curvula]